MLSRGRLRASATKPARGSSAPSPPRPDPYVTLAAAVLRQAITDARSSHPDLRREAEPFLQSSMLTLWLEICDADAARLAPVLHRAAGLA